MTWVSDEQTLVLELHFKKKASFLPVPHMCEGDINVSRGKAAGFRHFDSWLGGVCERAGE